jgi:hypothetical protein
VKRVVLSLLSILIASLCTACAATTSGNVDSTPQAAETRPPTSTPANYPSSVPSRPPSSVPTHTERPKKETLTFGKSYRWKDGVTLTVGKPKEFRPSEFAVTKKTQRYLRFTVTVVNRSKKPIDLGLTYISVKSRNKEAEHVFDSPTGLNGPPDRKIGKGKKSEFDVGFGVADPKDLIMELALHQDGFTRPSAIYST